MYELDGIYGYSDTKRKITDKRVPETIAIVADGSVLAKHVRGSVLDNNYRESF